MRLETVTPENWRDLIAAEAAVLMLGKSDCAACKEWTAELEEQLGDASRWPGVRFGKLLLDQRGFGDFKREHGEWLREIKDLPFNVIFRNGERWKSFVGGGADRLDARLSRL
jgi:hypothetical protein